MLVSYIDEIDQGLMDHSSQIASNHNTFCTSTTFLRVRKDNMRADSALKGQQGQR